MSGTLYVFGGGVEEGLSKPTHVQHQCTQRNIHQQ